MPCTRPTRAVLGLLIAVAAFAPVSAQEPKGLIPRQPPAVAEYVLGPGDQVSIHVVDLDDISDRPIRIDPNGLLDLALVGRVEAGGKTIEQLRTELATRLSKYITTPQISINLIDNQSRSISVIGAVSTPGVHALEGPRRLLEAISMAGGIRADAGSRVVLTRQARWGDIPLSQAHKDATGQYSTASVSLEGLLNGATPADNILVDPGDVISIPRAEIVFVIGNVKKAGGFPLSAHDSMSVVQTVSLAEGLDSNAAGSKARILRPAAAGEGKVREIPVNIPNILNGKDPDVPLFANDVLYVPNSLAKSGAKRSAEAILQVASGVIIYRH